MTHTGFNAYWIYMVLKKHHFTTYKYNIMKSELLKRDVFLKKWNDDIANKYGIYYLNVEKSLDKDRQTYIKYFSYYLVDNMDIFIFDIVNDGHKKYRKYENELLNIKDVVSIDFVSCLTEIKNMNKSFKDLFVVENGRLPLIFKMYEQKKISVHTLIAFNNTFNFFNCIDKNNLNIIERVLFNKYSVIFDKYYSIVFNHYKDIDFKKIFLSLIT